MPRFFDKKKNPAADTRLLEAAKKGDVKAIKTSLREGADPNVRMPLNTDLRNDDAGATPLILACWSGPSALEGVRALLHAGADAHARIPSGLSAILAAAYSCSRYSNGDKEAVLLIDTLIGAGAKADDGFPNGRTPLFQTIDKYNELMSPGMIKTLLKHGANPNARVKDYNDILTMMCKIAQYKFGENFTVCMELIKALLEAGAVVNPTTNPVDDLTNTPIGSAANGSRELTDYLLSKGANPDVVDVNGVTLLENMRRQLDEYLEEGIDVDETIAIINSLEQALLTPDGKGQDGGAAQQVSPHQTTREVR